LVRPHPLILHEKSGRAHFVNGPIITQPDPLH